MRTTALEMNVVSRRRGREGLGTSLAAKLTVIVYLSQMGTAKADWATESARGGKEVLAAGMAVSVSWGFLCLLVFDLRKRQQATLNQVGLLCLCASDLHGSALAEYGGR